MWHRSALSRQSGRCDPWFKDHVRRNSAEVSFSFASIRHARSATPARNASDAGGALHAGVIRGQISSAFVSIRLPRRSPWRAVVRRLPDEGGLAKAGVHLSRRLLAKTFGVASREGGFVISQKIVKKVLTFFGVPE